MSGKGTALPRPCTAQPGGGTAPRNPATTWRDQLALIYERLKRLAPLLSMVMQAMTLASVIFALVAWRGVHPAAIGVIMLALMAAGAGAAWLWYEVLGMKMAEERARIAMNPRDQDILTPKEQRLIQLTRDILAGDLDAWEDLDAWIKKQ